MTIQTVRSGQSWIIPSESTVGELYRVVRHRGQLTCDCLGFFHRGRCKHVTAVIAAETVRATAPVAPRVVGEVLSPERIVSRARATSLITGGRL